MTVLLYWISIRLYALAARVASLFNPKARRFIKGRKGLLAKIRYKLADEKRPRIWMHCASLGEFEQGRPVLDEIRTKYPGYALVLTFFSPSGYEVRKNYPGADYVFYLPLDSAYNARRFVKYVKPSLAIFVKYDLWYFYLSRLEDANVPILLISAIFRSSQAFFKWYGQLNRRMLQLFTHIFVQDTASQQMLLRIEVEHATVGGDTRFDRVAPAVVNAVPVPFMERFAAGSKLIVAGSTWAEDEALVKAVFEKLPKDWKLVIAPHEVHLSHIKDLMEQYDGDAVLWTRFEKDYYDQRILLIDTVGVLFRLYQYADVTYVGGGFNRSGIHNILEAAVYGKPIFHGPVYQKFKEAKELNKLGASIPVTGYEAMHRQVAEWETNRIAYNAACVSAKKYVLNNTGATGKILDYIGEKELLSKS